jgi:RNA recognition motif-containing protein
MSESRKIYIGGLSDACTKDDLSAHFGRYGKIASVWIARNPVGFAFVTYEDVADATEAVRVSDGEEFQGRTIRVELSKSDGRRGPKRGRSRSPRRDEYRRDDSRRDYDRSRDNDRDNRRDDYRRDYDRDYDRKDRRSRSRSRGRY